MPWLHYTIHNNLANFPVSRWRTWAWRGTWWRASRWRPRPAGRPMVSSSCRRARAAAWRKLSKDQLHSDIHEINKCCQPSNCDKSPVWHSDTLLCLQSRGRRDAGVLSFHCPQIPAGAVHLILHILFRKLVFPLVTSILQLPIHILYLSELWTWFCLIIFNLSGLKKHLQWKESHSRVAHSEHSNEKPGGEK